MGNSGDSVTAILDNLDALNDALCVLFYYEDDEYSSLAEDSVESILVDDWGCDSHEARQLLEVAFEIHEARMKNGFYD
jgi:hypothetical protein